METKKVSHDVIEDIPIFLLIENDNAIDAYLDKNQRQLLSFLKTPSTVEDLEEAFKKLSKVSKQVKQKHEKTIYRYLKNLVDAGLVKQAGKRISKDEKNQIRTQTIFSRTAKVFGLRLISKKPSEAAKAWNEAAKALMETELNQRNVSTAQAKEFFNHLDIQRWSLLEEVLNRNAETNLPELINKMEWGQMIHFLDSVSWILLMNKNIDLKQELKAFTR